MINTNRILVLGATGMLGHCLFAALSRNGDLDVHATVRTTDGLSGWFSAGLMDKIRAGVDGNNFDSVVSAVAGIKPGVVINCIGLIKHLPIAGDPIAAIGINALFPHRLASLCAATDARMIHLSTDCVFNGTKGMYTEDDQPDANDLYGRTKLLGEVDYSHTVTLRTSIIGHELKGEHGLIGWFLAQEGKIKGFAKAIYSGFPTVEMARIISDYVIPNRTLRGVYHVSSDPISKYDLLCMVAERYSKQIEIEEDEDFCCDRSLDSSRFRKITGYNPPPWSELVEKMHYHFINSSFYRKH